MKRPSTRMLVMGHPVVATPMTLACGSFIVAALVDGNATVLLLTLPVLVAVLKASQEAGTYREWVREWEAMGGGPRRSGWRWLRWPGAIALALGALILVGSGGSILLPLAEVVVGVAALVAVVVIPWTIIRWARHRHQRRRAAMPVRVVAGAVLPIPALPDAYRALPPHCRVMLETRK